MWQYPKCDTIGGSSLPSYHCSSFPQNRHPFPSRRLCSPFRSSLLTTASEQFRSSSLFESIIHLKRFCSSLWAQVLASSSMCLGRTPLLSCTKEKLMSPSNLKKQRAALPSVKQQQVLPSYTNSCLDLTSGVKSSLRMLFTLDRLRILRGSGMTSELRNLIELKQMCSSRSWFSTFLRSSAYCTGLRAGLSPFTMRFSPMRISRRELAAASMSSMLALTSCLLIIDQMWLDSDIQVLAEEAVEKYWSSTDTTLKTRRLFSRAQLKQMLAANISLYAKTCSDYDELLQTHSRCHSKTNESIRAIEALKSELACRKNELIAERSLNQKLALDLNDAAVQKQLLVRKLQIYGKLLKLQQDPLQQDLIRQVSLEDQLMLLRKANLKLQSQLQSLHSSSDLESNGLLMATRREASHFKLQFQIAQAKIQSLHADICLHHQQLLHEKSRHRETESNYARCLQKLDQLRQQLEERQAQEDARSEELRREAEGLREQLDRLRKRQLEQQLQVKARLAALTPDYWEQNQPSEGQNGKQEVGRPELLSEVCKLEANIREQVSRIKLHAKVQSYPWDYLRFLIAELVRLARHSIPEASLL